MVFNRRQVLKVGTSIILMGAGHRAGLLDAAMPAAKAAPRSELSSYDAMGLAELVRSKQVTPDEVLEDTIRKIEAVNAQLNAVIHKTYDRARKRAAKPLGNGAFEGVPFLVKDNASIAEGATRRAGWALRAGAN